MAPAMRLGFVVIPRDLVRSFVMLRSASDTFAPLLYQLVMNDFIREGHFSHHLKRMRSLYAEKRKTMVTALEAEFGDTLEIVGDDAGLHLVVFLPPGISDYEVSRQSRQNGISVGPLSPCYVSQPRRNGLVLGYAALSDQQIYETVAGLKTSIAAWSKHAARA
jgi:GntR family transcriptional regulator/MocR family aminotransferase